MQIQCYWNILYVASVLGVERAVTPKENPSEAKATENGGNRRGVPERVNRGGSREAKKEGREKNEQSSDGSACRAGIALHAGLKTSARNIAIAKALICNPPSPALSFLLFRDKALEREAEGSELSLPG